MSDRYHKLITCIVILCTSAVLIFALGLFKIYFHGKALPGTTFAKEQVGLMNDSELDAYVVAKIKEFEAKKYTVKHENLSKEYTAVQLGIIADYEKTRNQIKTFNAKKDGLTGFFSDMSSNQEVQAKFDLDGMSDFLEKEFALTYARGKNAHLKVDEKGLISVIPEKSGQKINTDQLKNDLQKLLQNEATELNIILDEEIPTLKADDIFSRQQELEEKLKQPITVHFQNQKWQIKPLEHLEGISFQERKSVKINFLDSAIPLPQSFDPRISKNFEIHTDIEIAFNENLNAFLEEEIAQKINKEMQSVKIYYDENKKVVVEGTAENGQIANTSKLKDMLSLALNNEVKTLTVPVKIVRAQVETDENTKAQGIKELIAVGHTTFYGSPGNRVHNIDVGMKKFDGYIIKQGEEFSFNTHLGAVEAHTGYLPELVIKGDLGTIPEYGGGLCQVSSTVYRAALLAGLPITERAAHSYAVSYYAQVLGYGLDATIYPGVTDLKFVNDTPGDILIQAYTKEGNAYFKFYGTDDNRVASLEGPYISNRRSAPTAITIVTDTLAPGAKKQTENPHNGFDVTWFRYLTKNGETKKETIYSNYKAMPAKILIGAEEQPTE